MQFSREFLKDYNKRGKRTPVGFDEINGAEGTEHGEEEEGHEGEVLEGRVVEDARLAETVGDHADGIEPGQTRLKCQSLVVGIL